MCAGFVVAPGKGRLRRRGGVEGDRVKCGVEWGGEGRPNGLGAGGTKWYSEALTA